MSQVVQQRDCISPSPGTPGEGRGEGRTVYPRVAQLSGQRFGPYPNPLPAYRARGRYFALLLLFVFFIGCAESKRHKEANRALDDYFAGDYPAAVRRLEPLAKKSNEDFVLNNVRLGSAALVDYDLPQAESAFLNAYEVINSLGVNNGGRSLGAVLVDEKIKIWKGEPFERAMANFYLGLIYYMQHDYGNARAAFENALFKLQDYDSDKDRKNDAEQESNFVLATIMLGKSWQRLGRDDLAHANFGRAAQLRPDLRNLADFDLNQKSNLLLVVDFGHGPRKVTKDDGSVIGFSPPPQVAGAIPRPTVIVDGQPQNASYIDEPTIDLLAMAQDRKWQSIDTIRAIKSGLGTGLLAGGAIMGVKGLNEGGARQRTDLMVAGGLAAAGLLLKATSQADVRQWEMLPRTVFVLPLRLPPGTHDITVDFPYVPGLKQQWRGLVVPAQGEATYYIRMQRWNPGPFAWPPPAIADTQSLTGPPIQNP